MGYLSGETKVTKIIGVTIIVVYLLQLLTLEFFGQNVHNLLFVLKSSSILHIWTWFTSIFAHSPYSIYHIIGNGIVLVFFAPVVERLIGSRQFAVLFVVSGVLAGLGQILLATVMGTAGVSVLGASGALLAVLGVLTVYEPQMTVYLYFLIPLPLWLLTIGFAGFSVLGLVAGIGNVAHGAHIIGLVIGFIYAYTQTV
jgi:membrane associated rhomboid family serine protease